MADETHKTQIRVPGKAMLMGEYIVLDGGPAVVAALTCYAKSSLSNFPSEEPTSPLVEIATLLAKDSLKKRGIPFPKGIPHIDTSEFFYQGQKLGLGSSAAVAVATIGTIFQAVDFSLSSSMIRSEIQLLALKAHQKAQGSVGSGADILASTWGGLQVLNSLIQPVIPLPAKLLFISTQSSSSTPELIYRYRLAGAQIGQAAKHMTQATELFLTAWHRNRPDLLIASVETAFECYVTLGHILEFPLITADHQIIHDLAYSLGGAAKPSGAGGGDIAIALFPSLEAEDEFKKLLPTSLRVLDFQIDELGIHSF